MVKAKTIYDTKLENEMKTKMSARERAKNFNRADRNLMYIHVGGGMMPIDS